jgi:hypothetical protein
MSANAESKAMKYRSDIAPQARRGFFAAFLDALHESRRRQAAREIEKYRYLIDEAKAKEMWRAIERAHAESSPAERRLSGQTDAWTQTARVFVSQ